MNISTSERPLSPIVVLDTNVVFDWLLFANADCGGLARAIAAGHVRWLATAAMQDEFLHVLQRGSLDAWGPDIGALKASWALHCKTVDPPAAGPSNPSLRCDDADDQKFIELAWARGARWLLSRDRAVLKLSRHLAALGVTVGPPGRFLSGP